MYGKKATSLNYFANEKIHIFFYNENKKYITFSITEEYKDKRELIKFSEVTEDKFYIGQRVVCLNDVGCYNTKNEKGTIVKKTGCNEYIVNFDNNVDGWQDCKLGIEWGHGLYVCTSELEPLEELKEAEQEIHITIKDRKTIAVLKENGKVTKRSEATCCPTDTFDTYTGVNVALARMFEKACDLFITAKDTIEVGDTVEVIDTGCLYSTYKSWFKYAKLECYEKYYIYQGQIEPNRKYIVVGTGKHEENKDTIYLIQNPTTRQVFIIGQDGIRKV